MKKTLALLMLAAMLLSTGCGSNAMDGAKKDAQDAAQKVEQAANEAKDAATAKVDEAKDAANQAASDASAKVDEMKSDAENMANDMKQGAENAMSDAADKMNSMADAMTDAMAMEGRTIALNGVMPGTSVEDVQAMFGEATAVEGKVMTFIDSLKVTVDDANKVKEISTMDNAFETPDGMYVGAADYLLNDYCGPADATRQVSDGVEYEYNSGDMKSKVVYKAQDGVITEIICSLK